MGEDGWDGTEGTEGEGTGTPLPDTKIDAEKGEERNGLAAGPPAGEGNNDCLGLEMGMEAVGGCREGDTEGELEAEDDWKPGDK